MAEVKLNLREGNWWSYGLFYALVFGIIGFLVSTFVGISAFGLIGALGALPGFMILGGIGFLLGSLFSIIPPSYRQFLGVLIILLVVVWFSFSPAWAGVRGAIFKAIPFVSPVKPLETLKDLPPYVMLTDPDRYVKEFSDWNPEPIKKEEEVSVKFDFQGKSDFRAGAVNVFGRVEVSYPTLPELVLSPRCYLDDEEIETVLKDGSKVQGDTLVFSSFEGSLKKDSATVICKSYIELSDPESIESKILKVVVVRPVLARLLWPVRVVNEEFLDIDEVKEEPSRLVYSTPEVKFYVLSSNQPFTEGPVTFLIEFGQRSGVKGKITYLDEVVLEYDAETASILEGAECDFVKVSEGFYKLKSGLVDDFNSGLEEGIDSKTFKCELSIDPAEYDTPQESMLSLTAAFEFESEFTNPILIK